MPKRSRPKSLRRLTPELLDRFLTLLPGMPKWEEILA